ncbi:MULTISPECIES: SLBB domain-containing protein [unclassified Leptolyngbya]|uniref:SLBB domain-containing protein n=1 Tax=unclassified Leptolyngbya TaxID=2650499 RepID=UPI0016850C9B|nr:MULTISPECIES: SLBB domain-containing protein [unclassified Leptolyngbya]MBD1911645.1 SLBB domain-containing protein [Leptolyngbya sp. FACHB-8]MBD2157843.1 SLBB domain-containing protein [Leptolyngbya sp. FACHB-16]
MQQNWKSFGVLSGVLMGGLVGFPVAILPVEAQTTVAQASGVDDGYLVGAGDRVRVDVFNVPEYSGEFTVLANGTVNLPVVGGVAVEGLTLAQASQVVAQRYLQVIRRPYVTLSLLEMRPVTVAIAGEISRPGSYTLDPQNPPSLTNALRQAGGVRQSANIRQVQIRRRRPFQQAEMLTVDLRQLAQSADLSQDILLRAGDQIMIPTAMNMSLEDARFLASTTFASRETEPIQVAIVGEVNRPGPHILAATSGENTPPTVTKAIQTAGGITQTADIRNIQIRRALANGQERVIDVDFWALLRNGDLQQDLPLQAGDTVVVPTATALTPEELTEQASASFSADSMAVNVVGEVRQPGTVSIPPNTPLNQAILTAGGFNNRARRGKVQLIRLNPDGTVSRRDIDVDFSNNANLESNPPLRPGDTVVVGRSGIAALSDALSNVAVPLGIMLRLFGI